jgi:hypothetical protein
MKHQGKDTVSPSENLLLPEVYTATVACIYNVNGKCKGMLTPERLNILRKAFDRANTAVYAITSNLLPLT